MNEKKDEYECIYTDVSHSNYLFNISKNGEFTHEPNRIHYISLKHSKDTKHNDISHEHENRTRPEFDPLLSENVDNAVYRKRVGVENTADPA